MSTQSKITEGFYKQLEMALKHFHNPLWLGQESSLASPYFLGELLLKGKDGKPLEDIERGQVLQRLLKKMKNRLSLSQMVENDVIRALDLAFFQEDRPPTKSIPGILGISQAVYYRYREKGIKALGDALIEEINPALRLEFPVVDAILIGREREFDNCLLALQQGHMVQLTGPSGIGKTMLGAKVAKRLKPQPTFWLTLRIGLNDRLDSFLLILAHFLHTNKASNLWHHLAANNGQSTSDTKVILELLWYDLEKFKDSPVVIILDEVDLLQPSEIQDHAQLLIFLESIRDSVALCLIGQQSLPIQPALQDKQIALKNLSQAEIQQLLPKKNSLSEADLADLDRLAGGNPRLATLLISLYQIGKSFAEVLHQSQQITVEYLLRSIQKRLDASEQGILLELSIYPRAVSQNLWGKKQQKTLKKLIDRQLVLKDSQGGVMVQPAYREILYRSLTIEDRELLHQQAVIVRTNSGEYTSAIYHAIQGRELHWAIWLWEIHSGQEIRQGQASVALGMLEQISRNQLVHEDDRQRLDLIRGELAHFVGESGPTPRIPPVPPKPGFLTHRINDLKGRIAIYQGDFEQAIQAYEDGLKNMEHLLIKQAMLHRELGWAYHRRKLSGDNELAWQESIIARHKIARLQGRILSNQGKYKQAKPYFLEALQLAEESKDIIAEADINEQLGELYGRWGEFERSIAHCRRAIELNHHIGRLDYLATGYVNLATTYVLAEQYENAFEPAQEGLAISKKIGDNWGISVGNQSLAEAHLALGNLKKAEEISYEIIDTEMDDGIPDALRVLGEIRTKQGMFEEAKKQRTKQEMFKEAKKHLDESIRLSKVMEDVYLEAYAWRAMAGLYVHWEKCQKAYEASESAVKLFESMDLEHEVQKTQRILAEVFIPQVLLSNQNWRKKPFPVRYACPILLFLNHRVCLSAGEDREVDILASLTLSVSFFDIYPIST